ncbi:hypothetical protein DOTSEDRAFT_40523 [Dothistroma septosporum NZE10]|uniref:Uncharacterized protein n=1 Tax=Dothistroma septosporum (strain NZE10 / CBS 128990) TaxID=675120 RepID=N1Q0T5_DOTSN|nr:hypothetical protein DOTSEDRAFT_40523 [Dothistroma septosporum NZE10]
MGVLKKTFAVASWSAFGSTAGYYLWTRKNKIVDVSPTDYIFNSTIYARLNPSDAPVTQDLCLRRVPLKKIRPELLEKEGKLVEAFCAGIWGGWGFAYQRSYLDKKYRNDPEYDTSEHMWDTKELKSSAYEVGTKITDHFEVVSKTGNSVIVRCGDSPRRQDVRASDGLFEMLAEVKEDEGVVEFGLKSIFFKGLNTGGETKGPMPPHIQWLHQQYDKIWMETALSNVTR